MNGPCAGVVTNQNIATGQNPRRRHLPLRCGFSTCCSIEPLINRRRQRNLMMNDRLPFLLVGRKGERHFAQKINPCSRPADSAIDGPGFLPRRL